MTDAQTHTLVLASGSRFKRTQLARLGLEFDAVDVDIDESPNQGERPDALATRLARQKARAGAALAPSAYVLGADQVISVDGALLHKPGTPERARAQLARLQGRTHDLHCAVAVHTPSGDITDAIVHYVMEMRALTDEEIARYVAQDNPVDCAGAYMIEAAGIGLFRAMRGDDYTAIIGLPLTRVRALLDATGFFGV